MKAWMRYGVVALSAIWLVGNIPAWLLLPTYTSHSRGYPHQVSYAIYYTLAPVFAVVAGAVVACGRQVFPGFRRWLTGGQKREGRAERIARLERELGIGQDALTRAALRPPEGVAPD